MIQLFRSYQAKSWPSVEAKVTSAQKGHGACTTVEITYKYRIDGELYTGAHTEPFLFASSADCYLEECSPGSQIVVRVKPGESELSVVRDRDVYLHAHGYRLDS